MFGWRPSGDTCFVCDTCICSRSTPSCPLWPTCRERCTGFGGGVVSTVIAVMIQIALLASGACGPTMSYAWLCFLSAIWIGVLSFYSMRRMTPRPGPPLPPHVKGIGGSIRYSWVKVFRTVKKIRQIPRTGAFLGLWFVYSDGFGSIIAPAALMAQSELDWGCFDQSIALGYHQHARTLHARGLQRYPATAACWRGSGFNVLHKSVCEACLCAMLSRSADRALCPVTGRVLSQPYAGSCCFWRCPVRASATTSRISTQRATNGQTATLSLQRLDCF
eukprot:m.939772 g.939772  ORF g.939772 m.939772 type:complete len:276 (-) comp23824_c0_seq18:68-895(-)